MGGQVGAGPSFSNWRTIYKGKICGRQLGLSIHGSQRGNLWRATSESWLNLCRLSYTDYTRAVRGTLGPALDR